VHEAARFSAGTARASLCKGAEFVRHSIESRCG
jgi:hypothetical protein